MQRCILVLAAASLSIAACGEGITEPIVPDAVRLSAASDTLAWGETTTLTASYVVGGATLPSDGGLRWSSSAPDFFSIDSLTGRGEAFEAGLSALPVLVIAESHGVADTMTVYVIPTIYKLQMTLSSAVALGRTFRPVIQALDGVKQVDFTPSPEAGTPVLRSSSLTVVSVGTNGSLTAVGVGQAWVTATLQGASDSTHVRVGSGYPISLIPLSGDQFAPVDVNDAGQAIATHSFGIRSRLSYLYDGDARISLLCVPRAINNAGTVVCEDGRVYAGGVLGPYPNGQVLASGDITDAGAVFGMRKVVLPPNGAERYDPVVWNGSVDTPLPPATCCGPLGSIAAANELGHVVGSSRNAPGGGALLLRGSEGRVLDLPRVDWGTFDSPVALAINDLDDVVGMGPKIRAAGTAAVWLAAEQWKGRFLGLRTQWASGVSKEGLVVGKSLDGAFVWRADRYALLSDLVAEDGWTISSVRAISPGGVILAVGRHTSGKAGLVRITAIGAP